MIDTNYSEPTVPMTKERVAEILYEALRQTLIKAGGVKDEEELAILMDFKEEFDAMGISRKEFLQLIQFVKNDVNESIKMK